MLGRYVGGTLLILGVAMILAPSSPETEAPEVEARAEAPLAEVQTSRAETDTVQIDLAGATQARDVLVSRTQTEDTALALAESEAAAVSALAAQLDLAESVDRETDEVLAEDAVATSTLPPASLPSITGYIEAAANAEDITDQTAELIAIAEGTAVAPAPQPVRIDEDKRLYVTGSRVNVRSGPSTGFGVIGSVGYGEAVELVTLEGDGWAQVRLGTGATGYMSRSFLAAALSDG